MRPRRILWISAFCLMLVLLVSKLLLDYSSSSTDKRLLQQALDILGRDPYSAEQILHLISDTSSPSVLAALTAAQAGQKCWSDAEDTLERWIETQPDDAEPWLVLAEVQQQQGKYLPCSHSLHQAINFARTAQERDSIRGKLFPILLLIDESGAAQDLLQNLETNQQKAALHSSLSYAHLLRVTGDWGGAIQLATQHVQSDPDPTAALMLRGIVELERKNFAIAKADLQDVVQQQPNNKEAHYKLAMALRELHQTAEAQKHLEISRQLSQQKQSEKCP